MDIVGAVTVLLGAFWALAKLLAIQFTKGLDQRFLALSKSMDERAEEQDKKLAHLDLAVSKIQEVELDSLRRHADYIERFSTFCTHEDLRRAADKHERIVESIYAILNEIRDKLGNTVTRGEFEGCRERRKT